MIEIIDIKNRADLFEQAVDFIWGYWGNERNFNFYQDCMKHSCTTNSDLPKFYIVLQNETIIGSYALLRNDLISRQDLTPWFACLYVVPELRGQKLGEVILEHAIQETRKKGYENLYLCTDIDGYYEKYGWIHLNNAFLFNGEEIKVYKKSTQAK